MKHHCGSGEMQGLNSLLTPSPTLQETQTNNSHLDPLSSSHDDFLDQMLSSIPSSSSWADIKFPWDLTRAIDDDDNAGFHFDESTLLASKLRHHQISTDSSKMLMEQHQLNQQQMLMTNDVVSQGGEGSVQALYNGFGGHGLNPVQQQFHHPQPQPQGQGQGQYGTVMNQGQTSGSTGGQPRQRVRARRGQATDPHSIAERLRRERIAERMKALQELVPNANKTDKASMLDEIIDYVKFLQLQVKVLSMSRLGGAGAIAPLVADLSSGGGGGDCNQGGSGSQKTASSNDNLTATEHQVARLMEEDMGSAMQYLQGKGLCLMPISLATAISTATCHTRNPVIRPNNPIGKSNNGEGGPSSPSISVLTGQSATMSNFDGPLKDAASISKP